MSLTAHASVFSDPASWRAGSACTAARTVVTQALSADSYYYATPVPGETLWGEYFGGHRVLISDQISTNSEERLQDELGTILHESQHHAGVTNEAVAEQAVACFIGAREEEDEKDDEDDGSSGNGGGSGNSGPTILSATPSPDFPGVWIVVIRVISTVFIGEITVLCDYEKDSFWPDCPDMNTEDEET